MKQKLIGTGFIALAVLVLFQDYLPAIKIPLWVILSGLGLVYSLVHSLFKKQWTPSFIWATLLFVLVNYQFKLIHLKLSMILLAAGLAYIGATFLFRKNKTRKFVHFDKSKSVWQDDSQAPIEQEIQEQFEAQDQPVIEQASGIKDGKSTAFSTTTRYIQDQAFVQDSLEIAFGTASIYFDHAVMLGQEATFHVDTAFSTVDLYLPANWRAEVDVDGMLTTVNQYPRPDGDKLLHIKGDAAFSTITIYSV
ncbi:hypothetical protein [Streptococcus suis]|uniref:hypothetical protein n=1 Tax=Streptococcus suis TaxID=1307 RepID=UPI001478FDDB